jgi:hypothetical protein
MIRDTEQTPSLCIYFLLVVFLSQEGVNQSDFSGSLFETASSFVGGLLNQR